MIESWLEKDARAHTHTQHTNTHTHTHTISMFHPLQQQLTPREARDERERQEDATYSTTDQQHTPQRKILRNSDTQHTERQRHASHTTTENTFSGIPERASNFMSHTRQHRGNRTNKDTDREWEQDLEFLQEIDLIRHRIATTTPSSHVPPSPPHELRHLYGRANQCSKMQTQYQNDGQDDASDTESRLDSLRRQ